MLGALCRAGLALGVVTNKPEALAVKLLQDLAVASRFGAVVGGDSTPHAKPHPAPVRAALAALGATPSEAAFVGDSAVDVDVAEAVGLPFHLFEGGYGARECDGCRLTSRFADHAALAATLLASARAAA